MELNSGVSAMVISSEMISVERKIMGLLITGE